MFVYISWGNIFDDIVDPCSYLNRFKLPVDSRRKGTATSASSELSVTLKRLALHWEGLEVMQRKGLFWEEGLC